MKGKKMTCNACKNHIIDLGDDHKCGFEGSAFDNNHNYSCITAVQVLQIAEYFNLQISKKTDCIQYQRCNGYMRFASIRTDHIDAFCNTDNVPLCLWISWKATTNIEHNLHISNMLLMFADQPSRPPTEEECLWIIEKYKEIIRPDRW